MFKLSSNNTPVPLRSEVRLLLYCARTHLDPESAEQIRSLINHDIDWEDLLQIAYQQGVTPLLSRNLQSACPDAVPPTVMERLRRASYANAQHNLYLTRALIKILNLFSEQQVSAIPYKGPMLAATAYGNLSLREFCDLDILVRERDVLKAMKLLCANGYRLEHRLGGELEEATRLLTHKKDFRFISDDDRVVVELHWRITGKNFFFPYSIDSLWERLEPVSFSGTTALSIPPEDLLVILCAHGSKHLWLRLLWICDINELIRSSPKLNWEKTINLASKYGGRKMLFLGLHLASSLLGAALPSKLSNAIASDKAVQKLGMEIFKKLFSQTEGPPDEIWPYKNYPYFIKMRERLRDKARLEYMYCRSYLQAVITPNELDREIVSLPTFFSFLYYLLRPMRLIKEHNFNPLRRSAKK